MTLLLGLDGDPRMQPTKARGKIIRASKRRQPDSRHGRSRALCAWLGASAFSVCFIENEVAAADTAVKSGALEVVVVTARKRQETLQDVPMAVSAVQGADLTNKGIDDVQGLYARVPNLSSVTAGQGSGSDSIYLVIRGVGFNGGQEPATGVFIDGVFQPQVGFDIGFLDLERVEVLRGPQGTLYGRNTQAGALNLVTRKPGNTFEGKVDVEAAEFSSYRASASIRGPLSEAFSAGIAAEYRTSDGYINNTVRGEEGKYDQTNTVRGSLRWQPGTNLDINLTGDFSRKSFNDMSEGVPVACKCYTYSEEVVEDHKDLYGTGLTVEWTADNNISLTSITGWRAVDSDVTADLDLLGPPGVSSTVPPVVGSTVNPNPVVVRGSDFLTQFEQRILSQEVRVAGEVGTVLNWQLGAYYFDQKEQYWRVWGAAADTRHDPSLDGFFPLTSFANLTQDRDGWALFGQASWHPASRWELTVGGRYAKESSLQFGEGTAAIPALGPTGVYIVNVTDRREGDFDSITGMGSISYFLSDAAKAYFTVSQGWKAGGFNKLPDDNANEYDDEKSINYEVGLKTSWFNSRIQANLALFYIDITDQQLTGIIYVDNIPRGFIDNAGKSRSKGAELELNAHLTDHLTISGSLGYTDARFVKFLDGSAGAPGIVRDGQRFPYVSELNASVAVEYTMPLSEEMDISVLADYTYVSDFRDPTTSLCCRIDNNTVPSQDRVNLQVSLLRDRWRVSAYVRNVFDDYSLTNTTLLEYFGTSPYVYGAPLAPRQVGVRVSREF